MNDYAGYKTASDLKVWEKAYWYLRILKDSDRFGNIGNKTELMLKISGNLFAGYSKARNEAAEDVRLILDSLLKQTLFEKLEEENKAFVQMTDMYYRLSEFLLEPGDYFTLAVTIEQLLLPTNEAVRNVPSKEVTDFARKYAKAMLDTKKEKALSTLLREWDSLTGDLAMNKEREIMVDLFDKIESKFGSALKPHGETISSADMRYVLTAVCQEYERRVGQKRKQRAGKDLEGATEFILNYFGITTHGGPEHFTTGLEVDNWLKDRSGWYIGISLKRTLRERWKQTYTTEIGLLDRFKIKNVIHLICNDMDLSDSKITELGSYRHFFFLADDSSVLLKYKNHSAMGKYLFPMSSLIKELKKMMA